ncbi:hypothetical protein WK27_05390 [Burkholderia vietnamiensis]|nr:hypothetical protein WK27_05390 [Burkholderia vietnamiensis]
MVMQASVRRSPAISRGGTTAAVILRIVKTEQHVSVMSARDTDHSLPEDESAHGASDNRSRDRMPGRCAEHAPSAAHRAHASKPAHVCQWRQL